MFLNNPDEIHVMLDLETVSTEPNASIIQIGACLVKDTTNNYKQKISLSSIESHNAKAQSENQFDISYESLHWWSKQDTVLRAEVFSGTKNISDVLQEFGEWLTQLAHSSNKKVMLWSNGADFDCVIIQKAFHNTMNNYPISYKNHRCYRTMIASMPAVLKAYAPANIRPHDALADAIYQARVLSLWNESVGIYNQTGD